MHVELSIVICTYNRYDLLIDAIASIEAQDCPPDLYELIVVDNSSDLPTQKTFLERVDVSCKHQIIVEKVAGLSRARNIGSRAAAGTLVAFMDDDAQANVNWASQIIQTMKEFPEAGIVGGPVRPIWPDARPAWLHKWLEGYLTIVDRGAALRALGSDEWLAGTNIAFRRDLLLASGLFSENLGRTGKLLLSNEEIAVTNAITAMGHTTIYNPQIEVFHRVHTDRINHAWMRRRVFWQVISDLFAHSESREPFEAQVSTVLDFLMQLPPKDRGLSGLFLNLESPDQFNGQMQALATFVRLMAMDGRDWRAFLDTKTH